MNTQLRQQLRTLNDRAGRNVRFGRIAKILNRERGATGTAHRSCCVLMDLECRNGPRPHDAVLRNAYPGAEGRACHLLADRAVAEVEVCGLFCAGPACGAACAAAF